MIKLSELDILSNDFWLHFLDRLAPFFYILAILKVVLVIFGWEPNQKGENSR